MKTTSISLAALAGLLLTAAPAIAGLDVDATLSCPAEAVAGDAMTLDVSLANRECFDVQVRIIASIVGNAPTLTSSPMAIFGPVVAASAVSVSAATDNLPGSCDIVNTGLCGGVGGTIFCITDADCICADVVPGTQSLTLDVPLTIPVAVVGTVASYLIISEWGDNRQTLVDECLVNIVSP
ncbi:MAG: hypothetical protein ACE5EV_05255 [Gaiellales bacterium]